MFALVDEDEGASSVSAEEEARGIQVWVREEE